MIPDNSNFDSNEENNKNNYDNESSSPVTEVIDESTGLLNCQATSEQNQ